jgi:hypothetical protein
MTNQHNHLQTFKQSLNQLLLEVSALEINTIIVEEIIPSHFIAWEVYRDIYPISRQYLQQRGIEGSLGHRYLDLRRKLELEYALLLTDPHSELYTPNRILPILTQPNLDWDQDQTQLPSPLDANNSEAIAQVQILLQQPPFLRSLRKLGELKTNLDNYHQAIQPNQLGKERVFAQTIIQLDGNIINRYSQQLLKHPQQNLILTLHQKTVTAGEKQWQTLLEVLINLVKKLI